MSLFDSDDPHYFCQTGIDRGTQRPYTTHSVMSQRKRPRRPLSYHTRLRFLLLPYLLGIGLLVVIPAALSLGLAFFHYDGLSPPIWAGTLNFVLAATDELFALSIQNAAALVILPAPLRAAGAFLVARLLQRNGRFLAAGRAAVFLPSAIPTAAYALAWLWILNPRFGPLALLLGGLGLESPAWFADPGWAKPGLLLILLWQIGEGFLVSLAALHDLPPELEEAAAVDGASPLQFFVHVTLPLLAPILLLLTFRDVVLTFQDSFTAVLFTGGGGPYYATYTLPLFIYEQGFDLLSFGVAGAALWVMYLLTGLIILLLYLVARQWRIGLDEESLVI